MRNDHTWNPLSYMQGGYNIFRTWDVYTHDIGHGMFTSVVMKVVVMSMWDDVIDLEIQWVSYVMCEMTIRRTPNRVRTMGVLRYVWNGSM